MLKTRLMANFRETTANEQDATLRTSFNEAIINKERGESEERELVRRESVRKEGE